MIQIEQRPTLLHMSGFIGLAPDHMMEILCLLGGALAFIAAVAPSYGGKFTFFLLWIFYISLYQGKFKIISHKLFSDILRAIRMIISHVNQASWSFPE